MTYCTSLMQERLKEERQKHDLTLESVGKIIGITKSSYRKYETGIIKRPSNQAIEKLAKYYNISPAYLLGFDVPREIESITHKNVKNEIINYLVELNVEDLNKIKVFIEEFINK